MEGDRSAFKYFTGGPAGKKPIGMSTRRWEDNIRTDLKEIGMNTRNWVHSAQNRDYWRAESSQFPALIPISSRSILIFSSHLRLGLPKGLFPVTHIVLLDVMEQ